MTGPCRGIVLEVNVTRRNGSEAYTKVQGRCGFRGDEALLARAHSVRVLDDTQRRAGSWLHHSLGSAEVTTEICSTNGLPTLESDSCLGLEARQSGRSPC
jgi:hypothetical protein